MAGSRKLPVLRLCGERLIHRHQGRDFRLTDVHGKIVHDVLV